MTLKGEAPDAGNTKADPTVEPPLPRVAKPRTVRRLCAVDIAELRSRVGRLTEAVWRREDAGKENDFFCFHHTRGLRKMDGKIVRKTLRNEVRRSAFRIPENRN